MHKVLSLAAATLFATLVVESYAADPPSNGDAVAGRSRFMAQCSLCHSAEPDDGLGGMEPPLHGLIGKPAASIYKNFPYTPALRASKLAWDAATLDRFLSDPSGLVPGTSMPIATDDKAARAELIAYFLSLKAPTQGP